MRPVLVACAERLSDFAGNVPGVPLIYYVQKWGKLCRLLVVGVHTVVNRNITDTMGREIQFHILGLS